MRSPGARGSLTATLTRSHLRESGSNLAEGSSGNWSRGLKRRRPQTVEAKWNLELRGNVRRPSRRTPGQLVGSRRYPRSRGRKSSHRGVHAGTGASHTAQRGFPRPKRHQHHHHHHHLDMCSLQWRSEMVSRPEQCCFHTHTHTHSQAAASCSTFLCNSIPLSCLRACVRARRCWYMCVHV